jgi:hypothetical protein
MDEKSYLRLKAKLDLDHKAANQAFKAADAEYETMLKSLDNVWALANKGIPPPMSINSHADAVNSIRGLWREIAHQIMSEWPNDKPFTGKQVQAAIADRNPELKTDPVSTLCYLKQLVRNGEIEIIKNGRGKNPTVFKKCPDGDLHSKTGLLSFALVSDN